MNAQDKESFKKEVMVEYMKCILNTPERLNDYIDEKNIFDSIARDGNKMAEAMIKNLSSK